VNIKDIAKAANVSTATVSRVLNNQDVVAEKSRKRVQEAVERLNYSPNALARSLITRKTNIIGVLLPDIANIYSPLIVASLAGELERNGYNIFLCITDADASKERHFIEMLHKKRAEGMIFLGPRRMDPDGDQKIIRTAGQMPVVMVDYAPSDEICCVRTDEEAGAYAAAEYLIRTGHKRIAFLNGPAEFTTYHHKLAGFQKAMKDYRLEENLKHHITVQPYFSGGFDGANAILDMPDRPTAIFSAGDQIAIGAYRAFYSRGMRIPDDISIVGFSGTQVSENIFPPLTTINQYPYENGIKAAEMMAGLLRGEKPGLLQIVLQTDLIARGSCRAVG
jgi:DNA-binding LacI/PurR family transcriptional regulator